MISNNRGLQTGKKNPIRESEDDFDKLIGHIEGSRIEKNVKSQLDEEDEDFF